MDPLNPTVIMLSGGINSVVAATQALPGADAHFLYFNHGHPAAKPERDAARRLAGALAARLHVVKLPSVSDILAVTADRNDADRPESSDRVRTPAGQRGAGVILTMLGASLQLARQINASSVVCGVSQACDEAESNADHGRGDPEARHIFLHAAETAMKMALPVKRRIELDTPFMDMERADIVRAGLRLGAPFHLSWSCHLAGPTPCAQCPGCSARSAAFDEIGLNDPIALQTS